MVLEFVRQGRHHDLLAEIHEACRHLQEILAPACTLTSPDTVALPRRDLLFLHVHHDREALTRWRQELIRLRNESAWTLLQTLDALDASSLTSILDRAEASLGALIAVYPSLSRLNLDTVTTGEHAILASVHAQLESTLHLLSGMESITARLKDRKEQRQLLESEPGPGFSHTAPASPNHHHTVEVSSYLEKQIRHGAVPASGLASGLKKILHFAEMGNIPSVPWHAEPHCYGAAPLHLNGVVVGRQERLIFFVDQATPRPVVRLCCWICAAEHRDAWSRLRHQNLYRRILSPNSSVKITRQHFGGFIPLAHSKAAELLGENPFMFSSGT